MPRSRSNVARGQSGPRGAEDVFREIEQAWLRGPRPIGQAGGHVRVGGIGWQHGIGGPAGCTARLAAGTGGLGAVIVVMVVVIVGGRWCSMGVAAATRLAGCPRRLTRAGFLLAMVLQGVRHAADSDERAHEYHLKNNQTAQERG